MLKAVAIIIEDSNGRLLIQDHVKRNFFTMPIGAVEVNETHHDAAVRELHEELNIDAGVLSHYWSGDVPCGSEGDVYTVIFKLVCYKGDITNAEPHKHRSLQWVAPNEIRGLGKLSATLTKYLDLIGA